MSCLQMKPDRYVYVEGRNPDQEKERKQEHCL